jgi:hypothetical protein
VADLHPAPSNHERHASPASRELEEALHRCGVLLHVEEGDLEPPGAEFLTGGVGVGSSVLPVDLDGLAHLGLDGVAAPDAPVP